jgi:xylulokinase
VARASRGYGLLEGLAPGACEQHPRTWIEAVAQLAREVLRELDPARLAGLAVSGQQHGCVALDERGEVVRPAKLWCDTETAAEAAELSQALGRRVPTGYTASKVLWLQRREPERWARVRLVLLPHDHLNLRLTGRATAEPGDASGTGWFDPRTRAYDPAAVSLLELAERLPPLVASDGLAGELSGDGAELLGLPESCAGLPVATGGGDNMLSAIGAGAVRSGLAVCSLGTSATVFTRADRPVVDPAGLIAPFCDSTGGWLPLLCVMNATGVLEEVRTAFDTEHATLTREAAQVERGSEGVTFVPYLQGERVPDLPHASGALTGLRPGTLRRGLVYRAALEGVALNLAWGVERLRALGLELDAVRLAGGGAANTLWRGILADALDAVVTPLEEPESAALGAALQACWVTTGADLGGLCDAIVELGEPVEPAPEGVRAYRELGERFRQRVLRDHGG